MACNISVHRKARYTLWGIFSLSHKNDHHLAIPVSPFSRTRSLPFYEERKSTQSADDDCCCGTKSGPKGCNSFQSVIEQGVLGESSADSSSSVFGGTHSGSITKSCDGNYIFIYIKGAKPRSRKCERERLISVKIRLNQRRAACSRKGYLHNKRAFS